MGVAGRDAGHFSAFIFSLHIFFHMANLMKSVAVAGAASATLQTAVGNYNTAIQTAITAAYAVSGVLAQTVKVTNYLAVWDGTGYVFTATVQYVVAS